MNGSSQTEKVGIDQALPTQRANFLRPDSSVVVLMLPDENDCSIQDEGYGWLIAHSAPMYRSTSACKTDPNDACCQSCGEVQAHAGCTPIAQDSECQKGITFIGTDDDLNLRCFNQKQRFSFDLPYSTDRYVSGFGDGQVLNRRGQLVDNPLFHRDGVDRDRSLFTLAVIGGVPWQDIATAPSLTPPGGGAPGTTQYMGRPTPLCASSPWPKSSVDARCSARSARATPKTTRAATTATGRCSARSAGAWRRRCSSHELSQSPRQTTR